MLTYSDALNRAEPIDPLEFRRVLGHYPAGVVAITSRGKDGHAAGMIVSSFTSVSLDPPLVAFLPAKESSTYQTIAEAGGFAVNVLAADQQQVCRALAAKGGDKFSKISWAPSPTGSPIIDGVVAWIDCTIEAIHDAGDHFIVIGRVLELQVQNATNPLLFFQGGYGRFASLSMSAIGAPDMVDQLRIVDTLLPRMTEVSERMNMEVLATARLEDELIAIATSGHPDPEKLPTRIGQRMPYIAPLGALFAAWSDSEEWIARSAKSDSETEHLRLLVERVRERGWSVLLGHTTTRDLERALARMSTHSPTDAQRRAVEEVIDPMASYYDPAEFAEGTEYPIRSIAVPVFDEDGEVRLTLTGYGLPATMSKQRFRRCLAELQALAQEIVIPSRTATH